MNRELGSITPRPLPAKGVLSVALTDTARARLSERPRTLRAGADPATAARSTEPNDPAFADGASRPAEPAARETPPPEEPRRPGGCLALSPVVAAAPRTSLLRPPPLLVGFVLLAIASLLVHLRAARQTPDDAEWLAAAQLVQEGWQEGDVLRLAPAWASRGLLLLDGVELDRVSRPELRTLQTYQRLWVLASHGHDCREGTLPGTDRLARHVVGGVTVCLFELPYRGEPLYDLRANLREASVRWEAAGKVVQECGLWIDDSWHCGRKHPWKFVGPVTRDVDDEPRRAIWAHPVDRDVHVVVKYPHVPMGEALELSAGLTLRSILSGEGSPTHLQVRVSEQLVLDVQLGVSQKGWFSWDIDTSRWAGSSVPVEIRTWARDNQVRQIIFNGRSWQER